MPDPPPPASASVAWQRCQIYLDRLFDALEALEGKGGLAAVRGETGWSAKSERKAMELMESVRAQLDAILAREKGGRREGPARPPGRSGGAG